MNNKTMGTDLDYGNQGEQRVFDRLQRLFGPLEHLSKDDPFNEFDFKNDNFYIEVKSRRNTKHKYPTTMVGENKVIKGFELQLAGFRVFFVFDFVDRMCLWELNRDEYEVRHGGRWDRGKPEIKSYCYIPIKYLMDVKEDADQIAAERTEKGIHHAEAVQQTALEDAGRDHPSQQGEGQDAGEGEEVKAQVTLGPDDPELSDDDTHLLHRDDEDY
eukprot:COSAG04_NODE_370_length_15729_cov_5.743506_10_plen_215_part_00